MIEQAKRLKKQLNEAKSVVSQLENKRRELQRQAEKSFIPEYTIKTSYKNDAFDGMKTLRITLSITEESKQRFEELLEAFGAFKAVDHQKHSVGYIYYEGQLRHVGGGYLLIDEMQVVSPETWKLAKAGDQKTIRQLIEYNSDNRYSWFRIV